MAAVTMAAIGTIGVTGIIAVVGIVMGAVTTGSMVTKVPMV
jgi:hypothetical protein